MKKTKKLKKLLSLFILVILGFILGLFLIFKKDDYSIHYQVNNLDIRETYTKKDGYYEFLIQE